MDKQTFYHDHWVHIEEERIARYEQMFVFSERQEPLLTPLGLAPGMKVADYGCGPAFMATELARRVGPTGQVYGLDINEEFLVRAQKRLQDNNVENLELIHLSGPSVPLPDNQLDRVFCKNVLEYVPDLSATLADQYRMLKQDGMIQVIDSDWGFVVVEPWGEETTRAFFKAASAAFNEPNIGRKLYGALGSAGFTDVNVQISAMVDTTGSALGVIKNMATYISKFDTLPESQVTGLLNQLDEAVTNKSYLFVLPQFLITAKKA